MNRLSVLLTGADVRVDVDAANDKRLFEQAGLVFQRHHAVSVAALADNLAARERLGSTGLGHGVAIPHGRIKGLKEPVAAVLRLKEPIAFSAPDDERVVLFVFLFVPEAATQCHLEILSEIAEMLSDRDLRDRLKSAGDAMQLQAEITAWSPIRSRR
jgi:nitrogen PTS system EIIA component